MPNTKPASRADEVLSRLPLKNPVTASSIATIAGISYSTVTEVLRKLAADGLAIRDDSGKVTTWLRAGKATKAPAARPAKAAKKAAQPAAQPPTPRRTPKPPAAADIAPRSPVAATIGYLESVRPVSAAPAPEPKRTRAPRDPNAARHEFATFERGQLRDAVLGYLQGLDEGVEATVNTIAKALNAQVGPVATNLARMCTAGTAVLAGTSPMRYRAA